MFFYLNKQGNTFIITIILLVLFSILGFSLVALTMSGVNKNEIRENEGKALALAEKGVDRLVKEINLELTNKIGLGMARDTFSAELNSIAYAENYRCNLKEEEFSKGYKACITKSVPVVEIINGNAKQNDIRELITIKSIGKTGESTRTIYTDVEIGAEVSPNVLNYVIGTNMNKKDGFKDGEGNLFLHGGVSITGDMKVDNNLISSKKTYLLVPLWATDDLPTILPASEGDNSKISLAGKSYIIHRWFEIDYKKHINRNDFSDRNFYFEEEKINNLFSSGSKVEFTKKVNSTSLINITDQKNNFYINSPGNYSTKDGKISDKTHKEIVIPTIRRESCKSCPVFEDPNGDFSLTGNHTFKKFSTIGNLQIFSSDITFSDGLYVGGDLLIGREWSLLPTNDNKLNGSMYVKGNVEIKGADLSTNLLIYSEGNVDIHFSKIEGINLNKNKRGNLIVFAKGEIRINFNSVLDKSPSEINGFFYSEKDLEVYGVASNLRIKGGLSAPKIILNGNKVSGDSRLEIIYDKDIIETYSNLKQPEPVIYNLEPPIAKNRAVDGE